MAVENLTYVDGGRAGTGSPLAGLTTEKSGNIDPYFTASLLADPAINGGLILTMGESGYIGITASVEPGENGNPDRIKAQLTQKPGVFQQLFIYTLSLSDWSANGGFTLSIDVYSYGTPSTKQGTFKFTKKGVGEDTY